MKIQVILGSTREGRQGEKVANWVMEQLKDIEDIEFELLDLRDFGLPYYDQPASPTALKGEYSNNEIKKWLNKVSEGDGYIIVTPEYNHGYPAVLKSALDWVYYEWNRKPVAFISYGGSAAGARSVEQLRLVAIELQMAPIETAIHIFGPRQEFDENGNIKDDSYNQKLKNLINDLVWWTKALKEARSKS